MDKTEMIAKVSVESGIGVEECEKVLDAFEEVLSEELATSKRVGNIFEKVYKIMSFLKGKKDNKQNL